MPLDDNERKCLALIIGLTSVAAGATAVLSYASRFEKVAQHTSILRGEQWIDELLNGHDGRFHNEMGMDKGVFNMLLGLLVKEGGLKDSRYVSAKEQLAIFLHFAHRALSNHGLQERFQRSPDTISKAIHHVLDALTLPTIYHGLLELPTRSFPIPDEIRQSTKYYPWFKDCIGAIDGTHIPMHVPEAMRASYRNRKGNILQNVLAACTLDMMFVYVLPGWEGSAADSRVFDNALGSDFAIPEGRYYLADAGYPNCDVLLVPYRGVRYHLKEWGQAIERRPQNYRELFNFRHAQLCNVIEHIFGVLKKRFKIMTLPQEYDLETQAQIVCALTAVHNFSKMHGPDDPLFKEKFMGSGADVEYDASPTDRANMRAERTRAAARRDAIAQAMWDDYHSKRNHS